MRRYFVMACVALIGFALLAGVLRNQALRSDNTDVPYDELLAYDLSGTNGVVLELQQETNEVGLTAWCVIASARPDERFNFAVDVEWRGASGQSLGSHTLAFETRASFATPDRRPSSFAARLAYSDALVTDARTVRVIVPEFAAGRPVQMRLSTHPGSALRILVRATFPERRRGLEIAAVDQRLSPAERLELVRDRASVNYDDLAYSLRSIALATWQRRLDASGNEGKDYKVERLLIGSGKTTAGLSSAQRRMWQIQRGHALAINVRDQVALKIATLPHTSLSVASGVEAEPRVLAISESGETEILAGDAAFARTLVLSTSSEHPIPVTVTVATTGAKAVIGPTRSLEGSARAAVEPMLRRIPYFHLDPEHPILLKVAPEQKFLGLNVRGAAGTSSGVVEADIAQQRAQIDVALVPSLFEQWSDGSLATDGQQLFIRIPPGAKVIALRGTPQLRVAPFTADPNVTVDRLSEEYAVPIEPSHRWLFAKFDITRMVPLHPDNAAYLANTSRTSELLAQSRIVGSAPNHRQPEELLQPTTETVHRHVIEPVRWGPELALPEDVAVSLDRPHRGYITTKGPRAGRARVLFRLGPGAVGNALELVVDGSVAHREETITNSGQFDTNVTPGVHTFEVRGADANSEVLVDVSPIEAAGALRRRTVHRILPGRVLRYLVTKQADAASFLVTTYSAGERLVALRYAILAIQQQDFLHAVTPLNGEISGVAIEAPGSWFWETGPAKGLRQHRGSIALGNDIAKGEMALVLRNQSRKVVWVNVVLVGQSNSIQSSAQRFWTTEEP